MTRARYWPPAWDLVGSIASSPLAYILCLVCLCSAYIQGPLTKIIDFPSAVAEMVHFGIVPAPQMAVFLIAFELTMSMLILTGFYRWLGALCLGGFTLFATMLAFRFWELAPGVDRTMSMNGFFEHLGLAGAFGMVALSDLRRRIIGARS